MRSNTAKVQMNCCNHEGFLSKLPFSWIKATPTFHDVLKMWAETRLRDAAQTRLMDAEPRKGELTLEKSSVDVADGFVGCPRFFFWKSSVLNVGLVGLIFSFVLFFAMVFVVSFFGLDDFIHFPPKIGHKTSWSEEIEEVVFPADSGNG